MLIIKVKNGKIEPALKQFKRKLRNTKLIKRVRDGRAYVKPSEKKRLNLQKAKYKESKRLNNEE